MRREGMAQIKEKLTNKCFYQPYMAGIRYSTYSDTGFFAECMYSQNQITIKQMVDVDYIITP